MLNKEGLESEEKAATEDHFYFSLTGKKVGSCMFRIVYAETWDWDVDPLDEENEDYKNVGFRVDVVKGGRGEKKEEEK